MTNTIFNILKTLGIPVVYGKHTTKVNTPYLLLTGAGQEVWPADDTYYHTRDLWTVEYYFTKKDPELEKTIEKLLLDNGYRYDKSEDVYLDDQNVYWLYYSI